MNSRPDTPCVTTPTFRRQKQNCVLMNDRRLNPVWNVRFSLRTLLLLAPLAAAALAFATSRFIRHNEVTVAGYVSVREQAFSTIWQPPRDANDDLMERTSDEDIHRAIGSLPPVSRAWIDAKGDPVAWMRSNIHITPFAANEILQVAIFNYAPTDDDIAAETDIINALMQSFDKSKPIMFMGQPMRFPLLVPSPADPGQYIVTDFRDVQIHPVRVLRNGWF